MLPWGAAPARPARSARMLRVRWAAGGGAENQVAPPCRQSRTQKTCPVPWRTGCFRVFPTWCPMPGARRGSDSDLGGQSCPRPRGAWAPASRGRSSTGREVTCPKAPEGRPARESEVFQSCPTLCDPVDCSLPGSSVHGIFQARILEWVAISFSRRIFPTQGLNPGLLHCRQDALPSETPGESIRARGKCLK